MFFASNAKHEWISEKKGVDSLLSARFNSFFSNFNNFSWLLFFFLFFFSNEIISLNKLNASESIEIVRRAFYFDSEKIWKIYEQNKNHILHDVHEHKSLWQLKCASSLMYSIFIYFVRYCFRLPPSYIHIYGIYILFGVFTVHSQSQHVALSNLLKLLEIHNCLKQTRASEENY